MMNFFKTPIAFVRFMNLTNVFRWTLVLIPLSITRQYVSEYGTINYEWRDLRIFGIRIISWGSLG